MYIYIYIHTYILMTCWLVFFVKALYDGGVAAKAGFSVCGFYGLRVVAWGLGWGVSGFWFRAL